MVLKIAASGLKNTAKRSQKKKGAEELKSSEWFSVPVRHGAVFGALELTAGGDCRRTFMVRLFTEILTVRSGAAIQNFRGGGESSGQRAAGGIATAYFRAVV